MHIVIGKAICVTIGSACTNYGMPLLEAGLQNLFEHAWLPTVSFVKIGAVYMLYT